MKYLIIPLLLTPFLFLKPKSKPKLKISPETIDLDNQITAFPRIQIQDHGQTAPMIIVIPGRNATETQLQSTIPKDLKARVFFLRSESENRVFFKPRLKEPDEVVTPALIEAGECLDEAVNKLLNLYPTNKLILFGFSAGGALALNYALNGKANSILAFSGGLPVSLYPSKKNNTKILMFHGNLDKTVEFDIGLNTAKAFEKAGFYTEFREKNRSHVLPPMETVKEFFKIALS